MTYRPLNAGLEYEAPEAAYRAFVPNKHSLISCHQMANESELFFVFQHILPCHAATKRIKSTKLFVCYVSTQIPRI